MMIVICHVLDLKPPLIFRIMLMFLQRKPGHATARESLEETLAAVTADRDALRATAATSANAREALQRQLTAKQVSLPKPTVVTASFFERTAHDLMCFYTGRPAISRFLYRTAHDLKFFLQDGPRF